MIFHFDYYMFNCLLHSKLIIIYNYQISFQKKAVDIKKHNIIKIFVYVFIKMIEKSDN